MSTHTPSFIEYSLTLLIVMWWQLTHHHSLTIVSHCSLLCDVSSHTILHWVKPHASHCYVMQTRAPPFIEYSLTLLIVMWCQFTHYPSWSIVSQSYWTVTRKIASQLPLTTTTTTATTTTATTATTTTATTTTATTTTTTTVVLCDVVLCNVVFCDLVFFDIVLCEVVLCEVVFCDVVLCDVVSCDVVLCDVVSFGVAVIWCSVV